MRSEGERNRAGSAPRRYWRRRLHPRENERVVRPVRSTTTYPWDRINPSSPDLPLRIAPIRNSFSKPQYPVSYDFVPLRRNRSIWYVWQRMRWWFGGSLRIDINLTGRKIVYHHNDLNLGLKFIWRVGKQKNDRGLNSTVSTFSLYFHNRAPVSIFFLQSRIPCIWKIHIYRFICITLQLVL